MMRFEKSQIETFGTVLIGQIVRFGTVRNEVRQ